MVLVGPSGCGKTTLLRSIGGLEKINAGRILIGDRDVTNGRAGRARPRDGLPELRALPAHDRAPEPRLRAAGEEAAEEGDRASASATSRRCSACEELLDRRPGQLSGGQMQRVAMGRAIIRQPAAFLMDEPLSNLDAKLRVGMRTSLQELHDRLGTTTVYVTHDQIEAMTLGQRVAVMHDGKIQQVDAPQRLYEHPANLFVAAFIGSPAMNLAKATIDDDVGHARPAADPADRARRARTSPPARRSSSASARRRSRTPPSPTRGCRSSTSTSSARGARRRRPRLLRGRRRAGRDRGRRSRTTRTTTARCSRQRDKAALHRPRRPAHLRTRRRHRLRLAVDPTRLYFFSAETGESLVARDAVATA